MASNMPDDIGGSYEKMFHELRVIKLISAALKKRKCWKEKKDFTLILVPMQKRKRGGKKPQQIITNIQMH